MSNVEITRTMYGPYGKCVKMTNGTIELYVTTDVGPRIIHLSLVGEENLMYNDTEQKPLGDKFDVYGGDIIKLYGGHRLWIAPEVVPRCYHPDNCPVTTTEVENGMAFSGAVEDKIQIQKTMVITFCENKNKINIRHEIKNVGLWDIELAPWCLTMMDKGGFEVMPQNTEATGLLPNRNFTLWAYSDMSDSRIHWGKDLMVLKQQPEAKEAFKVGYLNNSGWGAYFNKNQLFIKKFEPIPDSDYYPDNNCSYETYTNEFMLEIETLGELVCLCPEETTVHNEEWELYSDNTAYTTDEKALAAVLSQYVN